MDTDRICGAETVIDPLADYERYAAPDWDVYGAEPISAETLRFARKLIAALPNTLGAPDAAPAGDGTVALEWVMDAPHKLDKLFLDIGPGEEWRASWMLRDRTFDRVLGVGVCDQTKLALEQIFDDLSS